MALRRLPQHHVTLGRSPRSGGVSWGERMRVCNGIVSQTTVGRGLFGSRSPLMGSAADPVRALCTAKKETSQMFLRLVILWLTPCRAADGICLGPAQSLLGERWLVGAPGRSELLFPVAPADGGDDDHH
jgi:hypothetical protein